MTEKGMAQQITDEQMIALCKQLQVEAYDSMARPGCFLGVGDIFDIALATERVRVLEAIAARLSAVSDPPQEGAQTEEPRE